MLPVLRFLAPIGFAWLKKKVSNAIADDVENNIEVYLKNLFKEFYTNAIINVAALFLSIYYMPLYFNSEVARLLVCSVYLSSTLHALWKFLFTYFPHIWQLVIYGGNLKKLISDKVNREIGNLGLLEYIGFRFLGPPLPEVINIIMRLIFGFVLKQGFAMGIYIVIFRFIVAPWAVEDATGLNWYEAAIYPFLMAIDYFFGFETQNIFIPID